MPEASATSVLTALMGMALSAAAARADEQATAPVPNDEHKAQNTPKRVHKYAGHVRASARAEAP